MRTWLAVKFIVKGQRTMPLTRSQAQKLQQLDQFAFGHERSSNIKNEKKRKGDFNQTTNKPKFVIFLIIFCEICF